MTVRIITEPRVYLVGHSDCDPEAVARFIGDEGLTWEPTTDDACDHLPELAGRLCYMSFARPRPGGNEAYIGHIKEVGHGSVLEHATFNLIITGVSRSLTHELVRHRVGFSYSQLSQRFVDESDVAFVVPPALQEDVLAGIAFFRKYEKEQRLECYTDASDRFWPPSRLYPEARYALNGLRWLSSREADIDEYKFFADHLTEKLIGVSDKTARRKQAREAARSVLPNCTETKIFVTANARSLRHFVELRSDPAADAEIRRVAIAVLEAVRPAAPNVFGDYAFVDGAATTPYRKV